MRQLTALVWKEWREARAFLWIALGVFVGLPVIAGVEAMLQLSKRFEVSMLPLVLGFGGILAVFVAVGTSCRDFQGKLEDFWRSRPVGVVQWLAVKYCVGLCIVLAACVIPLALDFVLDRRVQWQDGTSLRQWYGFIAGLSLFLFLLLGFYSLGFLAGCLVRRAAHAAVLALAAMLLICLLPALLPPLARLGQFDRYSDFPDRMFLSRQVIYFVVTISISLVSLLLMLRAFRVGWRAKSGRKLIRWSTAGILLVLTLSVALIATGWLPMMGPLWRFPRITFTEDFLYAAAMLAIALGSPVLAIVAVQRGWRVESGRKMLYWAVGIVFVVIIGSAGYQVGTNLPVLQQISLPPGEHVSRIWSDGKSGFVRSYRPEFWLNPIGATNVRRDFEVRADRIWLKEATSAQKYWQRVGISPDGHPDIFYSVTERINTDVPSASYAECWLSGHEQNGNTSAQFDIWNEVVNYDGRPETLDQLNLESPVLYTWKDRLYVIGRRLVTLDISNPYEPKILSSQPFSTSFFGPVGLSFMDLGPWASSRKPMSVALPPIPGLPAKQRLEARLMMTDRWGPRGCFGGEIYCSAMMERLSACRLTKLTDKAAEFEPIGEYAPTLLQMVFGDAQYRDLQIKNGFVYATQGWGPQIGPVRRSITVFDVSHGSVRLAGHFAAPGADTVCPLPDGRAIVGGDGLWLVGPPPGYPKN